MTFGSLFSGIGGMDLGLERAGMTCRWQVEIDPFCRKVLAKHWPDVPKYGDIRELRGSELERVDCIAGGFPCQDLSQAGKRIGIEGTRSGLWFEFARLIGELRPRYVLIENVPGLLVHDAMRRVVGELARLRYVGVWFSLRASGLGAAHIRKRVFIVAHSQFSRSWPGSCAREWGARLRRERFGNGCEPFVDHAARDEQQGPQGESGRMRRRGVREASQQLADTGNRLVSQPWRGSEGGDGVGPASAPFQFAPGPADERWPAILSERPDLAPALKSPVRGMADGIPDWMDRAMSNRTKRLSRLGNGVVPEAAEWIGHRLMAADKEIQGEHACA